MKIQCVRCKEIVPIGTFRSSPAGIHVTCSACAEEFFVASGTDTESSSAKDTTSQPDTPAAATGPDRDFDLHCPKCGEGQPAAEACRVCGLRVALFDSYVSDDDDEAVAELEPRWNRLLENWQDQAGHKAFLDEVAATSQYAWAARRYRARLRDQPDDAISADCLKRIARMAQVTLAVANSGDKAAAAQPYKNVALLLIVLVLFAGLGGLYFLFKVKATAKKPKAAPDVQFVNPPVRAPTPSP